MNLIQSAIAQACQVVGYFEFVHWLAWVLFSVFHKYLEIVVDTSTELWKDEHMKNEQQITELTRKLSLGSHASHGVKAVLGKMPINMSDSRADAVLAELQARYDATEEGQVEASNTPWIEDMPMCEAARRSTR